MILIVDFCICDPLSQWDSSCWKAVGQGYDCDSLLLPVGRYVIADVLFQSMFQKVHFRVSCVSRSRINRFNFNFTCFFLQLVYCSLWQLRAQWAINDMCLSLETDRLFSQPYIPVFYMRLSSTLWNYIVSVEASYREHLFVHSYRQLETIDGHFVCRWPLYSSRVAFTYNSPFCLFVTITCSTLFIACILACRIGCNDTSRAIVPHARNSRVDTRACCPNLSGRFFH